MSKIDDILTLQTLLQSEDTTIRGEAMYGFEAWKDLAKELPNCNVCNYPYEPDEPCFYCTSKHLGYVHVPYRDFCKPVKDRIQVLQEEIKKETAETH